MIEMITKKQMEKMRLKAKKLTHLTFALSIASFPLYMWLFYSVKKEESQSVIFIAELIFVSIICSIGTLGIAWYLIANRSYNKFNETFKSNYVLSTINKISGFDKLSYFSDKGFSWDDVRNATVVDCGEKRHYKSEDMLMGEYEDVHFQISDITTQKIVYRDRKSKVQEIFTGQMLCISQFDDSKSSNGYLQIFKKEFLSDISGWKAEHKIHTENEIFNSRFCVYADDEHNAYYILTPQRMEKIISFSNAVGGQISLAFCNKKLFIAIKRESMFDAVVDKPIEEQTDKIIADAKFIQMAKEILI